MNNFKQFLDNTNLDSITEEEILEAEILIEKNVPTSPEKWAKAKAAAKSKFAVYPSAYANGWAAKKYKAMGGGWKSVSEAANLAQQAAIDIAMKKAGKKPKHMNEGNDSHEYADGEMSIHQLKQIKAHSEWILEMLKPETDMPEWVQAKITLAADYLSTACDYLHVEMNEDLKVAHEQFDMIEEMIGELATQNNLDVEQVWESLDGFTDEELLEACTCWTGYKRKPGTKPCAEDSCVKEGWAPGYKGDNSMDKVEKHRVAVTISDPNHTMVSKRKETQQKHVRVSATNKLDAKVNAEKHYTKQGFKVHGSEHVGMVKEETELDEAAVDAKGYKSSTGGLTQKGRDAYNRKEGSNLKAPVTTPPSKLNPDSKAAKRRKSFCARMSGVEGPMKKPNGEPTRKALALRKWNC